MAPASAVAAPPASPAEEEGLSDQRRFRHHQHEEHAPELTPEEDDDEGEEGGERADAEDGGAATATAAAAAVRGGGALFGDSLVSAGNVVPCDVEGVDAGGKGGGDGPAGAPDRRDVGGIIGDVIDDFNRAPVSSITTDKSPALLSESQHSSLSDGEGGGDDDVSDAEEGGAEPVEGAEDGGAAAAAASSKAAGAAATGGAVARYQRPLQAAAPAAGVLAAPQAPPSAAPPQPPHPHHLFHHRFPRNASADESRASTGGGLWGWFEDHDRSGSTPPASSDDLHKRGGGGGGGEGQRRTSGAPGTRDASGNSHPGGGERGSERSSGRRRFGLFHLFSSDAPLLEFIGTGKADAEAASKASAMAVTAPTYVLEESLSSQQLWKETAGNRPPQPAEERAFYEKIWAQNFLRSQVSYEMPVEVLTATSPISLSPFADGNFGEGAAPGEGEVSDYNVMAAAGAGASGGSPNGARLGKVRVTAVGASGVGPTPGAHVHPAEAAAAEASLLQRLGVAGAQHYYARPGRGGADPRAGGGLGGPYGPLRYHHTKVNQRMKGGGGHAAGGGGSGDHGDVLTVVVRGDNVFGTTVSKSFERRTSEGTPDTLRPGADTVSVSIASYRVVQSRKHGKYAQFLVIYCEGSFRDTVGVWKRYSDFRRLSQKVMQGQGESCTSALAGMHPLHIAEDSDEEEEECELLPNAVTSWKLLKKRQRWFRCLDAEYLSLKVFLLERFLHDILFESSSPDILRDFVGVNPKGSMKGSGNGGGAGRGGAAKA